MENLSLPLDPDWSCWGRDLGVPDGDKDSQAWGSAKASNNCFPCFHINSGFKNDARHKQDFKIASEANQRSISSTLTSENEDKHSTQLFLQFLWLHNFIRLYRH